MVASAAPSCCLHGVVHESPAEIMVELHYHNKLGIKVTIRLSSKLEDQGRNQASKCELFGSS